MTGSNCDIVDQDHDGGDRQEVVHPGAVVLSDPALPNTDKARLWVDPILGGVEATICRFMHHRFAPHTHDTLMLGLIDSGVKSFARAGRQHLVERGGISVVNPGEVHTGARASQEELQYRALYVPTTLLDPDKQVEISAATLADPTVFRLLWMANEAIISRTAVLEREERLLAGIGILGARYSTPRQRLLLSVPWRIRRAREILNDNWAREVSVGVIAQQVGLSPYHLMRAFRRHFGLPMHAYQIGLRVDRARQLLRQSEDTIADVALVCGFADQSHFTRRFKAHVGVTPAAYRNASRS